MREAKAMRVRCIAELRERKFELTKLEDLRFIFRWIEQGEELIVSQVVREVKGVQGLIHRMLGRATVVERTAYVAIHHELDLAAVVFADEQGQQMRALREEPYHSGTKVRFALKKGTSAVHLASECVSRKTAFRAVEAYYLDGHPPDWLKYRSDDSRNSYVVGARARSSSPGTGAEVITMWQEGAGDASRRHPRLAR